LRGRRSLSQAANPRHPHDLFTTASLLWPIVAGMQTNEAISIQPVVASIFDMSAGRFGAIVAAVIGLIGIVISGLALARSNGRTRSDTDIDATDGARGATVAMVLGLIGMVLGGLIVSTSDGGLGTGNGLGGAIVATVLGLIAVVLGGLARARRREVA
jgi:hypothetical protein